MTPSFINTDLELTSEKNLDPLIAAFGERVFVLHDGDKEGKHFVTFELTHDQDDELTANLTRWIDLLESLIGEDGWSLWDDCVERTLDIGIGSGDAFPPFVAALPDDLLRRLGSLRVTLALTIYPVEPEGI